MAIARQKESLFYRRVGIRRIAELTRPRLIPLADLTLPLESVYHFRPDNTATYGPTVNEPILNDLNARVFIEHVTELTRREGNPRPTVLKPNQLIVEYRQKHRQFKPLRQDAALMLNPRQVLVENYAMLNPLYRYTPSNRAAYFRWGNEAATFWNRVQRCHERFQWNQYVDLTLPSVLPSLADLKRFESGVTPSVLAAFPTTASLTLADLWLWLGDNRERSMMAGLTSEALAKVNFLVQINRYFFVLNLGLLDGFRRDKDDEESRGLDGTVLQRRFLQLVLGLRDLESGATTLELPEEEIKPIETVKTPETTPQVKAEATGETPPPIVEDSQKVPSTPMPSFDWDEIDDDELRLPVALTPPEAPVMPVLSSVDAKVDEERVPNTVELDTSNDIDDVEPLTYEEQLVNGISRRAQELQEVGLISPGAYRRAVEDAQTYKNLKDPYGSDQSMESLLTLTDEELSLPDIPTFKDRDTIPDKSMLSTKLKVMQQQYVNNVLKKDVVQSVLSVQKLGVAVKNYNVEVVQDTMNHYEIHTVTLKPVRGRQSTIRFRLPVIDQDGRFMSNGVKYNMRLQRSDFPIRKVSPSRVALTSYYNKTFVDRSSRRTNHYEHWLCQSIVDRGLDQEDTSITGLRLSNVFVSTVSVPRIYSLLAKRMSEFKAGNYWFYLDYQHRADVLMKRFKVDVNQLETADQVVVGMAGNQPMIVDANNTFYRYTADGLEVIGAINDLLEIDLSKAPLELAEMSVSNKILPVGIVLAYRLGLSELLRQLNCDVSRFRRGERIQLQPEEYSLVFEDEVLVLSKLDARATMVLSGFNRYVNAIKRYSVWDFDRSDVYLRLIEENKLGVRYLREIDTLFEAWMDPITEGLLRDMGEPTEFGQLLLRSVELLLTDFSLDEVDGAEMRYRGFERMAGMVYGEINRCVKKYNARASMGENAVEMNPHDIWQRIVNDPSVDIAQEANPMQNLREQEVMTYKGDGGRSGKSMVKRTRIYHESDVGVVSESTVDSGDVSTVAYLSPDANFINLRGVTRRFNKDTDGVARLLSSSALLAPGADHDDQAI